MHTATALFLLAALYMWCAILGEIVGDRIGRRIYRSRLAKQRAARRRD